MNFLIDVGNTLPPNKFRWSMQRQRTDYSTDKPDIQQTKAPSS
ncbi:MAG: hypothetical protein AAF490_25125 [Chloroflexota bacterium]